MIYGLIISAGNQTRFEKDIPKSLEVLPTGKTILAETIDKMSRYCDDVFVVCSVDKESVFEKHHCNIISITSGKGCGDAVLQALIHFPKKLEREDLVFIQWGDSVQPTKLYGDLLSHYAGRILVPCQWEENPYVRIYPDGESLAVQFSKYGEVKTSGLHDLSLFFGNALYLKDKLQEFQYLIMQNDRYVHKHGNEMQFLDLFNHTNAKAQIFEVSSYSGFSFNTVEEFENHVNKFDFDS